MSVRHHEVFSKIMNPTLKHILRFFHLSVRLWMIGLGVSVAAESSASKSSRSKQSFDASWSFVKGDPKGAEQRDFDKSGWRTLDLPHDWSIEGPFDTANPCGVPGSFLRGGIGWYRKTFRLPEVSQTRKVFIEFDAVNMNSEV